MCKSEKRNILEHIPKGSIKIMPYNIQVCFIERATMERDWHSGN